MILLPTNQTTLTGSTVAESADIDVLRETLLAIGRIPMLTGNEEERLARGIEAAKGGLRRSMLRFAPVVSQIASLLESVAAEQVRLDRVLDVTLADLKNKTRLRETARLHAMTLRGMLSHGDRPTAAVVFSQRRAARIQALADEAGVRTSLIEEFYQSEVANTHLSGALFRKVETSRARFETLRNRMVAANLRLAVSIAKKYQHAGVPLLDLIQEGSEGLIRAAEKFRPSLGFKFSTYAVWWIQQRVRTAVSQKTKLIRIGDGAVARLKKLHSQAATRAEIHFQGTAFEDLAIPELTPARREELRRSFYAYRDVLSLDLPLKSDSQQTHADTIPSEPVDFDRGLVQDERRQAIGYAFEGLTNREREVLKLRFGLDDGHERNLAEVGRRLGISRERVRQIEVASLQKLRHRLRE